MWKQIWNFPFEVQTQTIEADKRIKLGEKDVKINLTLTLEIEKEVIESFNKINYKLREYYTL